jgi:hypothetical protein
MTGKSIAFVIAAAAAAAAGCATSGRQGGADYSAAVYTGADQVDAVDLYAVLDAPIQASSNGAPFELVSYAGIEGARRAHMLYSKEEAEALDGRCERYVAPTAHESLLTIADLCDVNLETLVAYNPDLQSVSYAAPGAVVEVPGGTLSPQGAFAMSGELAKFYAVQEGDTLTAIADRLNVSATALVNANPDLDWKSLTAGEIIRKPIAAPSAATPAPSYAPAPSGAWQSYSGTGIGESAAAGEISALAPYALGPVKSYARPAGVFPDDELTVDRAFVKPGDSVKVTARAAPGTDVTFYSGDAPGKMRKSTTARADQSGAATATITVGKGQSMGGVVFGARPKGSSETQYSKRVGVVGLDEHPPAPDEDEDKEAAPED